MDRTKEFATGKGPGQLDNYGSDDNINNQNNNGESYPSDAYIGPPDDRDRQQTGLNMNLPGGIGTPIYAPFDMIYKSMGTDGNLLLDWMELLMHWVLLEEVLDIMVLIDMKKMEKNMKC